VTNKYARSRLGKISLSVDLDVSAWKGRVIQQVVSNNWILQALRF